MSAVWYTSDTHWGHKLVSGLRGFDTPQEHDEALYQNWVDTVEVEDTVYLLGDISVGGKGNEMYALSLLSTLPGRKILIAGNHDSVHPLHRNPLKYIKEYNEVFDFITPYMRKQLNGQLVELCHFPFTDDHTEAPRYMHHRRPDFGQWLVHGHTHSSEQVRGRELHCGLDAHDLKPVNQEWIIEQITEGMKNV